MCELTARWQLAEAWQAILSTHQRPTPAGRWRVVPVRNRVGSARSEITELVAVLCSPEPVAPAGVAMAHLLLKDGCGPLYAPATECSFNAAVQRCLDALGPADSW